MTDALIGQIASTGIVGVFCALALLMLWQKDKSLAKEMSARIEDARAFTNMALSVQKEVILAVAALTKIADTLEKREEERERLQRDFASAEGEKTRLERIIAARLDEDARAAPPHRPVR